MRLLTFTTLFPSAVQPQHGVFVENRLRHLIGGGGNGIEACVVAPVPWFPLTAPAFGRYARFACTPHEERRNGIHVLHPRYPVIPAVGMTVAPWLMYAFVRRVLGRIIEAGYDFDVIDAHYFYPDGVAAALLGRALGKPVTITARGSDVNVIGEFALTRRMIRWAAERSAAVIAVSAALKARLEGLGVAPEKVSVLRNGVDLAGFRPLDRAAIRARLGLDGPTLIAVGNVLVSKGQDIAIRALSLLDDAVLLIAGAGADEDAFRALARRTGVDNRVRFLGRIPHGELAGYYNAADISLLPSMREGWPNVLLESMACGTPAVASDVGGVGEIIAAPEAGRIMAERTPEALAASVRALLKDPPARAATRAYAEKFSWDATTEGQIALFREIVGRPGAFPG